MEKKRILSGMRPTGRLHLGHLLGAIDNWVKLQSEYECFFMVADWHALTTHFKDTKNIKSDIFQVVTDYISSGLDPEKCTFYVQSHVPEIAELHLYLSMIIPVSWLERCPSYKDQIDESGSDIATYGFLGYPVLMTADILAFKAELVPVGKDQLPHLELAREIVRRFNYFYGNVLPEPEAKLTKFPLVPGTDGRKMSKSYDNSVLISDSSEVIKKKVNKFITDPKKIYKGDPGHPGICNIFYFQNIYSTPKIKDIETDCQSGKLGCVDCKKLLVEALINTLEPIHKKRNQIESHPEYIEKILSEGAKKAREIASDTLKQVKQAMRMT